jgi:hypothetical protein
MFIGVHSATELEALSLVVHQWSVDRSSVGPERMSHERMVVDRASVGEWCSPMSVDRSSEDQLGTPMSVDRMPVDFASMVFQSPSRPMLCEETSMSMDLHQSPINGNSLYDFDHQDLGNIPIPGLETFSISEYFNPEGSLLWGSEPLPYARLNVGGWLSSAFGAASLAHDGMEMRFGLVADGLQPAREHSSMLCATMYEGERGRNFGAMLVCPIPGCGRTFRRHFKLKGALRRPSSALSSLVDSGLIEHLCMHTGERPYRCRWPGCPRSFARQLDCKQHKIVHLNIRPFTCEGCKKTFARMNAVNRHCEFDDVCHAVCGLLMSVEFAVKSEGGVECQKIQGELTAANVNEYGQSLVLPGGSMGMAMAKVRSGRVDERGPEVVRSLLCPPPPTAQSR